MLESVGHSVGRFDFAGALLAGAGGSCLMWAFVDLGEGQIGLMQAALIGAGIILLATFVWHEGRTPHPILPLTFFHHAGYASSICSSFLAFFSGFGLSAYLPLATNAAFHDNRAFVGLVVGAFTIGWSTFAFGAGRLVHRIGERLPSVIGIIVHILGLLFLMVAFEHGLGPVIVAALIAGAGMGLLSPALTVVVQNSVPVARMGSATTSQQFIRQIGAALGVSAFVLAATVGGFRLGLLLMIAVSAGTFACVLALPAHSLHDAHQVDVKEEKDLRDRTKAFALRIVRIFSALPKTTEAQVLGKQLLRSGTSIGANYREAFRARSKAEFIAKCGDSLREIEESAYWLELLVESGVVTVEKLAPLRQECEELTAIFVTILKRAKTS